jgi:ribonuclease R
MPDSRNQKSKHKKSGRPSDKDRASEKIKPRHQPTSEASHKAGAGTFVDRSGKVHNFSRPKTSQPEQNERTSAKISGSKPGVVRPLAPDAPEIRYSSEKSRKDKHKNAKNPKNPWRPNKEEREDRPSQRPESKHERGKKKGPNFRHDRRPSHASKKPRAAAGVYKATVDKNRKGFAFLIFENRKVEDAFVPPREADKLFHGDRVEVRLDSRGEVQSVKVISHRFTEVVGKFVAHPTNPARGGWIVYEQKRAREEIYIPESGGRKLESDDWVRAKLTFHDSGPYPVTGEILDVYGKELPPSADVGMIAAEFSLIEEHSEAAELEARTHKLEVPGKDLEGREDLRTVPFITIDGETARDFDDAVYVERSKSGYVLWVAIADVSHYVSEGSALDKDARSRGTSVYFPERAFHMLPRALSENLCSLRPHEPRLAMVAKMQFDRLGKIQSTEMMEAVIQSKRRATYNEIQAEHDAQKANPTWEYRPHFELYQHLKKVRQDRGSIDFDLPEAEVLVRPTGEVISIKERGRLDAHRLIEEFMIAANEAVTEWIMARKWPFVYRVHEEPAADSLERFQQLAATVGVKISVEGAESPKVMAELVRRLEGHPAQALLNMALLRSLKQAVYSSTHGIHYGLASEGYTHFTSPIRRYPDLVVHRLLRRALRTEKGILKSLKQHERDQLEAELTDICEHCSYRERLASDAERESIKLKQVRAMVPHLGDEFDSKIVGMIESGLFVKVKDPYCEGMVNRESMMDDFYIFNEDRMIFYGQRKKRTFKISDAIRVMVLRADIDRRQIDFGPVDESKTPAPKR